MRFSKSFIRWIANCWRALNYHYCKRTVAWLLLVVLIFVHVSTLPKSPSVLSFCDDVVNMWVIMYIYVNICRWSGPRPTWLLTFLLKHRCWRTVTTSMQFLRGEDRLVLNEYKSATRLTILITDISRRLLFLQKPTSSPTSWSLLSSQVVRTVQRRHNDPLLSLGTDSRFLARWTTEFTPVHPLLVLTLVKVGTGAIVL